MAQYEDITIDQGTDFAMELYLINKDQSVKNLSNHTVAGKLKKTYNSDSADTHDFAVTIATPTDGVATLSLTNTVTDVLKPGRYVYDVELSFNDSSGNAIIERVLEGKAFVTPSVTK